ncbi:MAG TPA: hypothetical protein VG186_18245 [Solirubrobacteraceae bacterium]|jgi:hypothetical protein|nr:hypothetical protein [Solirubrobacteraceae bacterium]
MPLDDEGQESFEDKVRSIAREVSRSIERVAQVDLEEIANAMGVDPNRATELVDTAMGWLRTQAEGFGDEVPGWSHGPEAEVVPAERLRSAGPHPLDLPTADQGLALAALDSGRWMVEPGSHTFQVNAEGPGPSDAVGLVSELRARDWIAADGEVTLVGRHALSRWLDSARAN